MNAIKTVFSIKDLENLSGVKAHTIRIWEKRYSILEPMRTETNIRLYDSSNLQKLLNITLLHECGYKISEISKLPAEKIPTLVREIISEKSAKNYAIRSFKMAMVNFDQQLFLNTYNNLLSVKTFREIFFEVFIPLLEEIGLLWQTDTISPAQEHFISNLIKQKLLVNTEKIQLLDTSRTERTFILFLPYNEIHEIGLMYINYEILLHGYKSIYLGSSIPINDLKEMKKNFNNITFVTYITIEPSKNETSNYIKELDTEILNDETSMLWAFGKPTKFIENSNVSNKTVLFESLKDLTNYL